jgi:hypothetical protein
MPYAPATKIVGASRGSKAALNTFMRSFAARHADDPSAMR